MDQTLSRTQLAFWDERLFNSARATWRRCGLDFGPGWDTCCLATWMAWYYVKSRTLQSRKHRLRLNSLILKSQTVWKMESHLEKGKAINTECLPLCPLYWADMKEQQMAFYQETLSQTWGCQTAIYSACFFLSLCVQSIEWSNEFRCIRSP